MINCWEYKKCGRQPNGEKAEEMGVCPAAIETKLHGINNGVNGGRACWCIAGTMCGGNKQGSFTSKIGGCSACDFYEFVRGEQQGNYIGTKDILQKLRAA